MLTLARKHRPKLWKGLVAGIAGGLAGTIFMSQFQKGWKKASKVLQAGNDGSAKGDAQTESDNNGKNPTIKVAGKIAELSGHELSHEQKKRAGPAVHYAFGTAMGAFYGLARERRT